MSVGPGELFLLNPRGLNFICVFIGLALGRLLGHGSSVKDISCEEDFSSVRYET